MSIFDINPDIRKAHTLSADFYTDERFFIESKEKIFTRSWQLVGDADDANNLRPATILEGFLDEPILLARDGENKLRCLSNVCTHRGAILVEKACRENGIRCRYHGRRFAPDGKFLSMPEFEEAEDFPGERDDLARIPLANWGEFLFASINPRAPFDEFVSEMKKRVGQLNLQELVFSETLSRDYMVNAHWALYCENYLEGFHIPFVHQSLNAALDYGSYTTEIFRFSSLQTGFAKSGEDAFDLSVTALDSGAGIAAYYFFIFPNLMFNFYPWGLSVNVVKPVSPSLTKISYLTYISDRSKLNAGAGADLNRVELEDQAIVESVQRGVRSRFYSRGRYSPTRERGTHHFHRLIAEFMN